jgi:iron complex outermembrane recepter protein
MKPFVRGSHNSHKVVEGYRIVAEQNQYGPLVGQSRDKRFFGLFSKQLSSGRRVMRCNARSAIVLGVLTVGAGSVLAATDPDPTESTDQQASADSLEEVVVTAQKREERLQDVPISMSVVQGSTLDNSSSVSLFDALGNVPGVAVTGSQNAALQGGGAQLTIRGVTAGAPTLAGTSPIAYYLDGIPFGLVKSAVVPDLAPYDLDRVEVLRGPQGTLYGASAEDGVVRVITNDADLENFDIKTRVSDGTTEHGGDNYQGDVAINVPIIDGKLAARAVGGEEYLSGWIDSPVATHVNNERLTTGRLKIDALPTDDLSVGLEVWHSESEYGAPSLSLNNDTITATEPEPTDIKFNMYGFKIAYDFHSFSLSSVAGYLDYDSDNYFDISPVGPLIGVTFPEGPNFPPLEHNVLNSKIFSEEINLASRQLGPWRWTAGLSYRDGRDQLLQQFIGVGDQDESKAYAVFGELSRKFLQDRLEWTFGGRYYHDEESTKDLLPAPGVPIDHFTASFSATTPRVVLSWYANPNLTAYASYSQGFRSGFGQQPVILEAAPGFPPVKPDKLDNYEIGSKGSFWDGRLAFDAAVYYVKWNDVQQSLTVLYQGSTFGAFVNAASASGPGAEFAITLRPVDGLDMSLNSSWNGLTFDSDVNSAEGLLFVKGQRLNRSPEYTAGASIGYTFPWGRNGYTERLAASGNYTSQMSAPPQIGVANGLIFDGSVLVTARASATLNAPAHWSVTAFVDNIGNNYRSPFPEFPGLQEWDERIRPRAYGLQFEYHLR